MTIKCCDPPCRLMDIQAMKKAELVEALVNAEEELAMALSYAADLKRDLNWAVANLPVSDD